MPRKKYKPGEIIAKLRQVDLLSCRGEHGVCDAPDRRELAGGFIAAARRSATIQERSETDIQIRPK